ncbi:MAG: hypothetical protein M1818_004311 [Claussenomyces sp. TS43310]|nr:MAG: hypothetical protein M1818_004311 [Claussenomyces sp. TS43310]
MDLAAPRGQHPKFPVISHDEQFVKIVKKLSIYVTDEISVPSTFEQLRTTAAGNSIRALVEHIVKNVTNPAIINALLTLKWHFSTLEPDDRGLNETRANACEIVAWRFLTRLAERDAVDYVVYELPSTNHTAAVDEQVVEDGNRGLLIVDERSSLLPEFRVLDHPRTESIHSSSKRKQLARSITHIGTLLYDNDPFEEEDPASSFVGLNALEIAAVADAKKFLSQPLIQKIIYGMWTGEITFWESLTVQTKKKAQFYDKRRADPFSRLRVPKYIKTFEVLFFALFLLLYYAVLVERNPYRMTAFELLLYVWLAAFTYDELSEFVDAGLFYYTDFWSSWDLAIIMIGVAFLITRIVGLFRVDDRTIDIAFDILSLEALFLVPRICSLLSLHPYFGTLIPCLKEMTKDFCKFMVVVAILYIGFLTTFSMLARDHFTLSKMSWILIKVFFGSSYIGFDIMHDISPQLGPPLMLVFVTLTQILLITSLISILSNSFVKVTSHAREEYLYVYSVYVLEASTSNRLTHFLPPLNLIPLIFIRPLRLFVAADQLRGMRILLLKITHAPIVAAIMLYESLSQRFHGGLQTFSSLGPSENTLPKTQPPFLINRPTVPQSPQIDIPSPSRTVCAVTNHKQTDRFQDHSAIEKKVEDLTAKIEELTALILAQQRTAITNE